jgi:hypothetical protein
MKRLTLVNSNSAPSSPAGAPETPVSIVALRDRREPAPFPFDDLRQLIVIVWARNQLIERLLAAQGFDDPRLFAGLADIDAAVTALGIQIDSLEETLPFRAA